MMNPSKYNELCKEIAANDRISISLREKYICLKRILERNCKELTREESLQFPSLFARLVFIAQKYNLPKSLEWQLQNVRVKTSFLLKNEQNTITEKEYKRAKICIEKLFLIVYEQSTIEYISEDRPENENRLFLGKLRVQVLAIDTENELIFCKVDTDMVANEIKLRYNVQLINQVFNSTIEKLWIGAQLNLIDCKMDKEGICTAQFIVLEPDYLIDASALAECFQSYGKSHLHYFRKKFEQTPNSHHILMGNLANFFLDEIIFADNPSMVDFNESFLRAFKQSPFEYTSCEDIKRPEDFKNFMSKARTQFDNIKRVILHDFPKNKIDIRHCTLEPSFCCEKFGFQGRLDLLQLGQKEHELDHIVELKSGGLPYPKEDSSKIALNHEAQTAIYRLIVESVFDKDYRKIQAAILYSTAENIGENMRLSAPYKTLEKEIVNLRNLIVSVEHDLYTGDGKHVEEIFAQTFNLDNYGRAPQFFVDRLNDLEQIIEQSSTLEREYVFRYISFITRELYLQKVGDERFDSHTGTSALWNTEFQERLEAYDLIPDLRIVDIDDLGNDMKILFERHTSSNFVNFREGEICILYPKDRQEDNVLSNQILKGTVVSISSKHVLVRFRYKQRNKDYFDQHQIWTIEHDKLDHAHNAMYKGLFAFFSATEDKRKLLLGINAPLSSYEGAENAEILSAKDKQNNVIEKAMAAKDYFLIVGPPGTGKTSIFARRLIELLHADTSKNILVMAYTNRAVDELCDAINIAFGCGDASCDKYIRIGTELSCGEPYRHRLLQIISRAVKSRDELRSLMFNQRIYVGTLASISGKPELFGMKKFDIAIIDEASQITEPQLIGLLPKFDKFIMIGDHKQLSTITLQDELKSKINNPLLNEIGVLDCSESFFERIYRRCQTQSWTHAYDTLTYQGRMHQELASFPNSQFYDNMLLTTNAWQEEALSFKIDTSDPYLQVVSQHRIAFVANKSKENNFFSDKINEDEACIVVALVKAVLATYKANDLTFDPEKTLGIITPYRNQIALIKHKLEETCIAELSTIMVDTVERYQGSQRDVIILSFCMNRPYQLDFFCKLNSDATVDRKLNVALTRARQQLFLVGNESILRQNNIYRNLLESMPAVVHL